MKKIILVLILSGFAQSQNFWEQTNGLFGGSTGGVAENSVNELFVGATYFNPTKVLKSTDQGQSWFGSSDGIGIYYSEPEAMVISGNDYIFFSGYETGIFRSTNNGEFWEQLFWGRKDIYELMVTSNDYIFAGVADDPFVSILRSTNYGDSWENISGQINKNVYALTSSLDKVFAGAFRGWRFSFRRIMEIHGLKVLLIQTT